MKTLLTFLVISFIATSLRAQYNYRNLTLASESTGAKFTYGNLRMYPVYANDEFVKSNATAKNYISLKEAMEKEKIKITEKSTTGESAEVNNLIVENNSTDTVMILGGEVIEGGKQDRMIASDIVIPPKSGKVNLDVFCVEHGRWKTKGSGNGALHFSVGNASQIASPEVRKAGGVTKDQSTVWSKVKEVTDKNECKTSTGAYTSLETDSTYIKKATGYRVFFNTILKSDPKIIGMVCATGNRVIGCDLFANHEMLMKHSSGLINSYSTEAFTNGHKISIPYSEVKSYTDKILADETKQEENLKKNGTMLKHRGAKIHISSY